MQAFLESKSMAQEKQLDRQRVLSDTSEDKNGIAPSTKPDRSEYYQGVKSGQIGKKEHDLTDVEAV